MTEFNFIKDGKQITVYFDNDITKISFDNDGVTGLPIVYEFNTLFIKEKDKLIHTTYKSYNITPTGEKINEKDLDYSAVIGDYEYFFELLGAMIKRSIANGLAYKLGLSKFFNEDGSPVS